MLLMMMMMMINMLMMMMMVSFLYLFSFCILNALILLLFFYSLPFCLAFPFSTLPFMTRVWRSNTRKDCLVCIIGVIAGGHYDREEILNAKLIVTFYIHQFCPDL